MKTPDEIKKGLECCTNDAILCSEKCPYYNPLSNGVDCAGKMHTDALALIQQLEADLEIAKIQNQHISEVASAYEKDIEKLERERDEALKMLRAAFSFPEM